MEQLDMFEEQAHRRAELKLKPELSEEQRDELVIYYVSEYLVKRGLAWYQDKWYYAKDQYKLLHHLMEFALGKKKSIAGWVLAEKMFNNRNTEKLRTFVNDLRNDPLVDVIIGSWAGGYFIAKEDEKYEAIKYIYGKSINEMITVINMFPALAKSYIAIAQKSFQTTDKAYDKQVYAQFEKDTDELLSEIVVRYADTLKHESYKK